MGSKIQWTGETWNVVVGCRRVSPGCENCYAERTVHRAMSPQHKGLTVLGRHGPRWNGEHNEALHRLDEPLRRNRPTSWFVNSLSDLFFEPVRRELIAAMFGVMGAAYWHTFQALTKRPEEGLRWFDWYEGTSGAGASFYGARFAALEELAARGHQSAVGRLKDARGPVPWPLHNVQMGVSVEGQKYTERVDRLAEMPAALRWVSQEPQLERITYTDRQLDVIDWLVIGGESQAGARGFNVEWARHTIAQCNEAAIPVFVKQLGARPYRQAYYLQTPCSGGGCGDGDLCDAHERHAIDLVDRAGGNWDEWTGDLADLRVREMPELD